MRRSSAYVVVMDEQRKGLAINRTGIVGYGKGAKGTAEEAIGKATSELRAEGETDKVEGRAHIGGG